MRRKDSKRRRNDSESESSFSEEDSYVRPEELYRDLKHALIGKERPSNIHHIIYKLEKNFKQPIGVLRVSLPDTFTFSQSDMEEFFKQYGKIERIVLKEAAKKTEEIREKDQSKENGREPESIAYVIYNDYCSALLALKVINSTQEKERIIRAKICHTDSSCADAPLFSEPLIDTSRLKEMTLQIEKDYQFGEISKPYKYIGTIGLDLTDRQFKLRERILGVDGCNFVRIYYVCQKMFQFEHEHEQSRSQDLVIKLLVNRSVGIDREVLILSHSLYKYNQAMRCLHELLEQIVEEYKNCKEKLAQIIPRDVHVRRWQKFTIEPQLKFLT